MRKILSVGIILFLSSACLPHVSLLPEKNLSNFSSTQEVPSLFTSSEITQFFSHERTLSSVEGVALSSSASADQRSFGNGDLPVSDESNDDFNLEILSKDRSKSVSDFDIPIVINAQVEQFIYFFQTTIRTTFSNWLARSEKYIPFMKNLLRENGLPEDLVYMALIESGFNPKAFSRKKASGPWQFIYLTGKRYGLQVNWWIDERRDPEKSTIAAAKYLKDLYDMFECWYLAAAGYNAGEGKIFNAMKRYKTEDFWELIKYRYLKKETKDYVPQMIAAALIAKDPEKYGFVNIDYQEPLRYEKVEVPGLMDLRTLALACEISVEELTALNPELLRWCTPPHPLKYELKIPLEKKELFLKNMEALPLAQRAPFKIHTVKKGESLPRIVRLYQVDVDPIREINQLTKASRLTSGTDLIIPIPKIQASKSTSIAKAPPLAKDRSLKSEEVIYTIKKGDTLWSIANEMGVNIGALSHWNNIHPEKRLIPGDRLKIRLGNTPWSIAKKFNLTIEDIKTWNRLNGRDRIHPSDQLRLRVEGVKSSTLN
jgi:membrane-bound lytic murein transglycosylase D